MLGLQCRGPNFCQQSSKLKTPCRLDNRWNVRRAGFSRWTFRTLLHVECHVMFMPCAVILWRMIIGGTMCQIAVCCSSCRHQLSLIQYILLCLKFIFFWVFMCFLYVPAVVPIIISSVSPSDLRTRSKYVYFLVWMLGGVKLSHAEYVPTLTAATALRVKAALSKAAWWPWPLTFWPWKWCPSHVWCELSLCQFWSF